MSSRKLSLRLDQEVREAFALFDRDGDGKVTKQEIVDLIKSLEGDPECKHVQVLLSAAEVRPVTIDQFMSLWKSFKASCLDDEDEDADVDTEEDIQSAFRSYDADGDGYITKDEMVRAITRMGSVANKEEEAAKCIREMDLDGDGRVSFAEFMVKWRVT